LEQPDGTTVSVTVTVMGVGEALPTLVIVTGSPIEVKIDAIDAADAMETSVAKEVAKRTPEPVASPMDVNTEETPLLSMTDVLSTAVADETDSVVVGFAPMKVGLVASWGIYRLAPAATATAKITNCVVNIVESDRNLLVNRIQRETCFKLRDNREPFIRSN